MSFIDVGPIADKAERQREYVRRYTEKNRERLREHITCECGCTFMRTHKSRHLKTKIHTYRVISTEV